MADDTTDTTPGSVPDVLRTGSDGSLPDGLGVASLPGLGLRRAWVWMQDTSEGGGGRFDVLATRVDVWRRKGATVVPNYPVHVGPAGRTAKPAAYLTGIAGERVEDSRLNQPTGEPVEDPRLDQPTGEPVDDPRLDQADGEPAAADTTTTTTTRTKGGRTR